MLCSHWQKRFLTLFVGQNMTESFVSLMSGNTKFFVRQFAEFIDLQCEHQIPCKDCVECWGKICEELREDMAVKL
jgi:hypothetical protein